MMLNNTGYLRRLQGRLEEAEAYHLRSLEIREEIGDRVGVGRIHGMLSVVYSAQGQYENAKTAATQALDIARETHDRLFEATSLAQKGDAELELNDPEAARLHYAESRDIFVDIKDPMRVLQCELKIARIDLADNQLQQAGETASQVLETARAQSIMQPEVEALELLGDLEMARGNTLAAISGYQTAIDRLQETTWASKENTLTVKLADAYLDIADLEAAAPLIGALAGGPLNVPSLKTRARFTFTRGDAGKAITLMSQAKELAGAAWSEENEAALMQYTAAQNP